jgi:hypothetical protein
MIDAIEWFTLVGKGFSQDLVRTWLTRMPVKASKTTHSRASEAMGIE